MRSREKVVGCKELLPRLRVGLVCLASLGDEGRNVLRRIYIDGDVDSWVLVVCFLGNLFRARASKGEMVFGNLLALISVDQRSALEWGNCIAAATSLRLLAAYGVSFFARPLPHSLGAVFPLAWWFANILLQLLFSWRIPKLGEHFIRSLPISATSTAVSTTFLMKARASRC